MAKQATTTATDLLKVKDFSVETLSPDEVHVVKSMVAKNATDEELKFFLYQCAYTGLNPLLKEIWFVKYSEKDRYIMTSRDGLLKKAQQNAEFKGIQSMDVRANDDFQMGINDDGEFVVKKHDLTPDRGEIVGAWACVTYADGSRDYNYITYAEVKGASPVWKNHPTAMVKKSAEAPLLRKASGMTGVYTPEEIQKPDDSPAPEDRKKALDQIFAKIDAVKTQKEYDTVIAEISRSAKGFFKEEQKAIKEKVAAKKMSLTAQKNVDSKQDPKPDTGEELEGTGGADAEPTVSGATVSGKKQAVRDGEQAKML